MPGLSREVLFKIIGLIVILGSVYGGWLMMDYRSFVSEPIRFGEDGLL